VISSTPLPLYPQGRSPDTHWIVGWVDPRAGLDDMAKRKLFTPTGTQTLTPLSSILLGSRYTDYSTSAHLNNNNKKKKKKKKRRRNHVKVIFDFLFNFMNYKLVLTFISKDLDDNTTPKLCEHT
jgi:hypothetical protein